MSEGAAARWPQGQVHRKSLSQSPWGSENEGGAAQAKEREGQGMPDDRDTRNKGSEAGKNQKPGPAEEQVCAREKQQGEEVRAWELTPQVMDDKEHTWVWIHCTH